MLNSDQDTDLGLHRGFYNFYVRRAHFESSVSSRRREAQFLGAEEALSAP